MSLSDKEKAVRQRLKDDFSHYASKCLKIRDKSGKVTPFTINKAQKFIHEKLEEQLSLRGYIRAIILKGRQQGCSTYVGGRFYWKVSHRKGVRAFILTHDDSATANLFEMTQRYHDNCPEIVRPLTGAANAKELYFSGLDSGYKVGTAGNKAVGRSNTIQYFHGSEVAFWPNAAEHAAGIMQAIPTEQGTEVILESTAFGMDPLFYQTWISAESGASDYIAIFVPWYWQPEYKRDPPPNWQRTSEEDDLAQSYGMDDEQLCWRRNKIVELSVGGDSGAWKFKREYPMNAAEAFQSSGHDSLIHTDKVAKARKCDRRDTAGPLIVGVDPARFGDDKTSIIRRIGARAYSQEQHGGKSTMEVAGLVKRIIETEKPTKVFIDVGGIGAGVYDRLVEMGFSKSVRAVDFGGAPLDKVKYYNKRSEMYGLLNEWLDGVTGVSIPDDDMLHADLCAAGYSYDSNGAMKIEKKEDIKKRIGRSPDRADSLALTFAEPVRHEYNSRPMQADSSYDYFRS
jgi:hypothetical protein